MGLQCSSTTVTSDLNPCSTKFLTLSLKEADQWKCQPHLTNLLNNFKQVWEKSRPGKDSVWCGFQSLHKRRKWWASWASEGRKPPHGLHCSAGASPAAHLCVTLSPPRGGFPAGSGGKWWAGVTEPLQNTLQDSRLFHARGRIVDRQRGHRQDMALSNQCQARGLQQRKYRDPDKPAGVQVSLSPTAYETCSQEIVLRE